MRSFLFLTIFFSATVWAEPLSTQSTEEQLKQAIYQNKGDDIQSLLAQYQQETQSTDTILIRYANAKLATLAQDYTQAIKIYREIISERPELNSIRMELARVLFADRQDNAATLQFNKVKSAQDLPASAYELINQYIEAINERNGWQIDGNLSYLKTNNVENVSGDRNIENTGFIKNEKMLPKKAEGVAYYFSLSRDFNVAGSHYLGVSNETVGKSYWNNHAFDDLINRTSAGYAYKKNDTEMRLMPFYEKRWFGGSSFHWSNGVEMSYRFWLAKNWQNYTALSYEKRRFFSDNPQAGNIRTASTTFVWYPNAEQIFYVGSTFSQERLQEKQYSSDIKNVRFGWLQEYRWGISTKLNVGFTDRQFKDNAKLGGILPLNKTRKDKIYSLSAQIWKRDWHLWGITPKLHFEWRKQKSNLPSLYAYQTKNTTILFEKTF